MKQTWPPIGGRSEGPILAQNLSKLRGGRKQGARHFHAIRGGPSRLGTSARVWAPIFRGARLSDRGWPRRSDRLLWAFRMQRLRRTGDSSTLQSPEPLAPLSPRDDHSSGVSTRSRCLSEDDVLALCEGRAAREELPRIDEHLDQCEACRQWVVEMLGLAEVEFAPEDGPEADPDTLHPTILRQGSVIAERFRIARFIKRGGMGEVYEAFDRMLEAPVALKTIISTACDSPKAIRKLKAEVQLARSVRHPNVCSVFDFWEHREGEDDRAPVFFFTMEFIDGETLGQRLRRERLTLLEVRRLARLQLLGLRAAHVAGVVHRDFKSDNVMLRKGGRDGEDVVVMDFGLARVVPSEGGSLSNDSEQFAGSVAYMAPEQVEGRKHIGTEADVFAFGVVLFEMLTGQLPWSGDSPWTTATKRLTERAPPPSRLASGISAGLDAFVLKCLSRYPNDRYKDAQAALDAFDALAPTPAPRPRAGRWAAAIAVAFMLSALGATVWSTREPAPPPPPPHARGPREVDVAREAAALQPQPRALPSPTAASPPAASPAEASPAEASPAEASPAEAPRDLAPGTGAEPATPRRPPDETARSASATAPSVAGARSAARAKLAPVKEREASQPAERPGSAAPADEMSTARSAPLDDDGAPPSADGKKRKPGAPPRLRRFE